jgi:hypothetical protein
MPDRKLSASVQAAKIQARIVDDVIVWTILPFDIAYMLIRAGKGMDLPVLSVFCTGGLHVRADGGSPSWRSRLGIRIFGHTKGMSRLSYSPKIAFDAGIDSRLHLFSGVSIDSRALLIAWITNEAEQRRLGN